MKDCIEGKTENYSCDFSGKSRVLISESVVKLWICGEGGNSVRSAPPSIVIFIEILDFLDGGIV